MVNLEWQQARDFCKAVGGDLSTEAPRDIFGLVHLPAGMDKWTNGVSPRYKWMLLTSGASPRAIASRRRGKTAGARLGATSKCFGLCISGSDLGFRGLENLHQQSSFPSYGGEDWEGKLDGY